MAAPRNQKLRHENFLTDMTPLVTIYTPVYNGQKHIGKCIESILNQTYRNIQYLIIDDCSTDNTPDIIRSYDDPRIEYVRRNQNKGFPYCEDMMHLMRGDFITTVGHDDRFYKSRIENLLNSFMINPKIVAAFDKGELIDEDENVINEIDKPECFGLIKTIQSPWRNRFEALVFSFSGNAVMSNPLYSMDVFRSVSENGNLSSKKYRAYCHDAFIAYSLLSNKNVELIDKVQYKFMIRNEGLSNNSSRLVKTLPKWFQLMSEMRIKLSIEEIFPQIHDCDSQEEENRLRAEAHLYLATLMAQNDGYHHNLSIIESDIEKAISYDHLSPKAWEKLSQIRIRLAERYFASCKDCMHIAWSLSPHEVMLQNQLKELYSDANKEITFHQIPKEEISNSEFRHQTQWSTLNESVPMQLLDSQKTNGDLSKENCGRYKQFDKSLLRPIILSSYFPPHHLNSDDEMIEKIYRGFLRQKVPIRVLVSNYIAESYSKFEYEPIPEPGIYRELKSEVEPNHKQNGSNILLDNTNKTKRLIAKFNPNVIFFWDLKQFTKAFKVEINSLGITCLTKKELLATVNIEKIDQSEQIQKLLDLMKL